jgi:2-dehydro-3-deoxyphosphogluconate aldolase / (4S)-4-hydroxy-2-oxoglutarate aldolase
MMKLKVLNCIVETGVVAVIRADTAEAARRICDACCEGGIRAIEITFTISAPARIAILAGAQFIVSPALNVETARLCNRYQIPYMPGAGTAGEVIEAMECGADIVKAFPGETLGPPFVQALKAALPQASLMPTGGVTLENAGSWIRAGSVAVGVGGHLTKAANIAETAKSFLEEVRKARA